MKPNVSFAPRHEVITVCHIPYTAYGKDDPPDRLAEFHMPRTDVNPMRDLYAYAEARFRAVQLADEVDDDVGRTSVARRGCREKGDDRRPVVVYQNGHGWIFFDSRGEAERLDRRYPNEYSLDDFFDVSRRIVGYTHDPEKYEYVGDADAHIVQDRESEETVAAPSKKKKKSTAPPSSTECGPGLSGSVHDGPMARILAEMGAQGGSMTVNTAAETSMPKWTPLDEKVALEVEEQLRKRESLSQACDAKIRKAAAKRAKGGPAEKPMVMASAKAGSSVNLWLIDTGCGHDLVSRHEIKTLKKWIKRAERPITFITANGNTDATEAIRMFVEEFGEDIEPYVLENTPAVLFVGFRCME